MRRHGDNRRGGSAAIGARPGRAGSTWAAGAKALVVPGPGRSACSQGTRHRCGPGRSGPGRSGPGVTGTGGSASGGAVVPGRGAGGRGAGGRGGLRIRAREDGEREDAGAATRCLCGGPAVVGDPVARCRASARTSWSRLVRARVQREAAGDCSPRSIRRRAIYTSSSPLLNFGWTSVLSC
jgi:hypothetical protein